VNQDGFADIVTGMGKGGSSKVKVFNGLTGALITKYKAFPSEAGGSNIGLFGGDNLFRSGVRVGLTDANRDGRNDIVVAPGRGEKPRVKIMNGLSQHEIDQFFAYDQGFLGGVFVA
jgi:hypothetical protein